MAITTLRPRVQTLDTRRTTSTVNPSSWRAPGTDRGYGYAWQQARLRFLREHPLCVFCKRDGRITAATVVDHITPHRGDQMLFWDRTNWQPLCASHHSGEKQRMENRKE